MGAKILSFINLKGGVAKTTTTVGTAEFLAGEYKKKVLVIDLDPQTNCTVMLIGDERWRELNDNGFTLATLFDDAVKGKHNFNLERTLQKNVSGFSMEEKQLKDIIFQYGLDKGTGMKLRKKEKLVSHIIETVRRMMTKGDVFKN